MKTRSFQTKFWLDSFVQSLPCHGRLIFNFLMTNERVNIIYCYECPDAYISLGTGCSMKEIAEMKRRLEEAQKVFFYEGYVFLRNGDKYQRFTGDLNQKAKKSLEGEMSKAVFSWYKSISDTPIDTPIDTSMYTQPIGSSDQKPVTSNQKPVINDQKPVTSPTDKYAKSLDYLLDVPADDQAAFGKEYDLSKEAIRRKADALHNYCESSGKTYKNYRAWLKGKLGEDAVKLRAQHGNAAKDAPRWYTYLDWQQQHHWNSVPGMHFRMTAEEAKDFTENWEDPNKETFVIELIEPDHTPTWIEKELPLIGGFTHP
jgi:hypothetical protein